VLSRRDIAGLEAELKAAKSADRPVVIVIDTDPGTLDRSWRLLVGCGNARSVDSAEVMKARARYVQNTQKQRLAD
jgi:TPP-dependent trihydroxycyclohexane-1,2-dione (THcHDO) dehydratase